MELHELLNRTITARASDLHLIAGYPPSLRVDGELAPMGDAILTEADVSALVAELLPAPDAAHWAEDPMATAHFGFAAPGGTRLRVFIHKHAGGSAITLRVLPANVPSPEMLGLPQALVERLCGAGRGLVLITGEAGSGKSTTLYSLVEHINATRRAHIVFICSFAEYAMQVKKSLIRVIEVGSHLPSYAEAGRACIRIDPDVVVFSEWRDLETISLALVLAEMGHLVFAQLHCVSAAESIARIPDVFPTAQQGTVARRLAACLRGAVAQKLVPKANGDGRVAALEVILGTPAVREMIAGQRFRELPGLQADGEEEGMCTMNQYLRRLVEAGVVRAGDAR